ncbi:unnamed protein product (macronuclear) [Paramecium tetraurelia]|uniref:Uncharacterized protein n=1 Tax=Paramecium tetraurelia TaxID=5888 RepID=A0CPR2_PARTE|nr:uncharacterized protein GSPATT00009171001 [Paramecium tetraurelia]CAK72779.1 unnamed protein product [Paramecium tetraurelia]|eukprot:XP_001440176.1 hypothetical protein (macronuclear) [Paramecium tetraurelia strain d4-2]
MQPQQRMGTAAMRVPTRMTTAMRNDPNFQSVANTTNLKFVDRPVTQHGIIGVKPTTAGPGRQIQDKSYYLNQLREKQKEIFNEIERFKKQQDEIQKANTLYVQFERRHEELTKEVRDLEGQLADYNLAFDKWRANTRPEDIKNIYERIKIQNERQRSQLDDIFIERRGQEDSINQIENRLNELQSLADMKLQELDPEQRNEYMSLINENKSLQQEINNQKAELEELNARMQNADNRLRMDAQKLKGQMLKEQINEMDSKKNDLESNLTFPEARDRLLNKIKDDNAFIQNSEKRVREIRRNIENYEKRLRELQTELEDKKSQEQDKQKYEILYQRDQEMTDYINNFDKTRQQELEKVNAVEQAIVELLGQSSRIVQDIKTIPSLTDYAGLSAEVDYKDNQVKDSEMTLKKLQGVYEQTIQDLKKIERAEEQLPIELQQYKQKCKQMQDEIDTKFNKIDEYKVKAQDKKLKLENQKKDLLKLKDDFTAQSQNMKHEFDVTITWQRRTLCMNNTILLADLEKKVSQLESQANTFQMFIETKSKDMNFEQLKKECMDLMDKINKVLCKT